MVHVGTKAATHRLTSYGDTEVAANERAARCANCGKTLLYPKHQHPGMWRVMLDAFINQHYNCAELRGRATT